jgi:hypothetical protein
MAGGAEVVKTIAQAKLAEVVSFARFRDLCSSRVFQFLKPFSLFSSFHS